MTEQLEPQDHEPQTTPDAEAPKSRKRTITQGSPKTTAPLSSANDERGAQVITLAKPLAMKIARVMSELSHVPKNGRNNFLDYNYITESDLVDSLRGKLAEQGVAIFPSILEHKMTTIKDQRGKPQLLATVTVELTFVDGDSGDEFSTIWVGQGIDQGDKGYYKAYTGAFKYGLMKTFLVTGEDETDEVPAPRRIQRR